MKNPTRLNSPHAPEPFSQAARGVTRRQFLHHAGEAALIVTAASRLAQATPSALPIPIGYATISWPDAEFEEALGTISSLRYKGVQMLGWVEESYSGEKAPGLKAKLTKLKLFPEALSCSGIRLRPDSPEDFVDQFRAYADFLHGLGGKILQLTDSSKPFGDYTDEQVASMGAKMNALGKIAKASGLTAAYHPHFGTLGETRKGLGRVLAATDPQYVSLIVDVAHLTLGGADPAEVIRTYHQRLVLLHLKDVVKSVYDAARRNRDEAAKMKKKFCVIGTGAVNFPAIIAALRDVHYKDWGIVELDSYIPPAGGPAEAARANKEALERLGFKV